MAAEPRAGWQAGPQGKGEAGGVKREERETGERIADLKGGQRAEDRGQ